MVAQVAPEALRAEIDRLMPVFEKENQRIARRILSLPPERARPLATAFVMLLKPFLSPDDEKQNPAAVSTFITQLPPTDRHFIERYMSLLHERLFEAIVASAPNEVRPLLEEIRIWPETRKRRKNARAAR